MRGSTVLYTVQQHPTSTVKMCLAYLLVLSLYVVVQPPGQPMMPNSMDPTRPGWQSAQYFRICLFKYLFVESAFCWVVLGLTKFAYCFDGTRILLNTTLL